LGLFKGGIFNPVQLTTQPFTQLPRASNSRNDSCCEQRSRVRYLVRHVNRYFREVTPLALMSPTKAAYVESGNRICEVLRLH